MRQVVFCADDLGLSAAANDGIRRAARAGWVREVAYLPTGPEAAEGARVAADLPFPVGLHLAFTDGVALTGPLAGLTDRGGRFLPLPTVLASCLARRPRRDDVRREVEAQWDAVERLAGRVVHVTGHHHAHAFPGIREVVLEVARARQLPYLRVPADRRAGPRLAPAKRAFLARVSAGLARALAEARGRGPAHLPFVGLGLERERDVAAWLAALGGLGACGPLECVVHPARPREREALTSRETASRLRARGLSAATFLEALDARTRPPARAHGCG